MNNNYAFLFTGIADSYSQLLKIIWKMVMMMIIWMVEVMIVMIMITTVKMMAIMIIMAGCLIKMTACNKINGDMLKIMMRFKYDTTMMIMM